MVSKELNVHIGEIKIARNGEVLKAILGSCVGIGFIWKQRGICGLAHCLLPEAPVKSFEISGRYVDQAIPSLMALMKIHSQDLQEIEVIVAGGGNMTQPYVGQNEKLVGTHNLETAKKELIRLGLKIVVLEEGKKEGKKIIINAKDGSFCIVSIPRIINAG